MPDETGRLRRLQGVTSSRAGSALNSQRARKAEAFRREWRIAPVRVCKFCCVQWTHAGFDARYSHHTSRGRGDEKRFKPARWFAHTVPEGTGYDRPFTPLSGPVRATNEENGTVLQLRVEVSAWGSRATTGAASVAVGFRLHSITRPGALSGPIHPTRGSRIDQHAHPPHQLAPRPVLALARLADRTD